MGDRWANRFAWVVFKIIANWALRFTVTLCADGHVARNIFSGSDRAAARGVSSRIYWTGTRRFGRSELTTATPATSGRSIGRHFKSMPTSGTLPGASKLFAISSIGAGCQGPEHRRRAMRIARTPPRRHRRPRSSSLPYLPCPAVTLIAVDACSGEPRDSHRKVAIVATTMDVRGPCSTRFTIEKSRHASGAGLCGKAYRHAYA